MNVSTKQYIKDYKACVKAGGYLLDKYSYIDRISGAPVPIVELCELLNKELKLKSTNFTFSPRIAQDVPYAVLTLTQHVELNGKIVPLLEECPEFRISNYCDTILHKLFPHTYGLSIQIHHKVPHMSGSNVVVGRSLITAKFKHNLLKK
jgi:hypothetical protein